MVPTPTHIRRNRIASAAIPVLGFSDWEYDMLDEVLVYPRTFDGSFGYDGTGRAETEGLVGGTGGAFNRVLALSRGDLFRGFRGPGDKANVGIHEFAHLVDKGDGAVDGIPAAMPREAIRPWLELMHRELRRHVRGRSDIPEYAFTNEQEFFAVLSEYFFESPDGLAENHPALHEMLCKAFRQDTLRRLRAAHRAGAAPPRRRQIRRRAGRAHRIPT